MKKTIVFIVLIAVVVGVKLFYIDRVAQKEIEEHLEEMDSFVNISYDRASVDVVGWNTRLKNVTISPAGTDATTKVRDVIIYDVDEEREIPAYLHVAFKGFDVEVNRDNFGKGAEDLHRMGYEKIEGQIEIDYQYDPEKKAFHLKTFRVGADDVGEVAAEIHISNVDLYAQDLFSLLFALPKIFLHRAKLRYEDDSFVRRLQKLTAEQQGKTVDELVEEMTQTLDQEIEREENKFTKAALKAIKEFVKDPDEIKIVISPKEPVSAGKIQKTKPKALPELLNIKIKT